MKKVFPEYVYKGILEFAPILIFIGVFEFYSLFGLTEQKGFLLATQCMIISTLLVLILTYVQDRYIPLFPVVVSAFTTLFGIISLLTHNTRILILRDTLYDLFFAVLILGGLCLKRLVLKKFFNSLYPTTDSAWKTLSYLWGGYFMVAAISNELLRRFGDEKEWVHFKIFGIVVTILLMFFSKYIADKQNKQ